MTIKEKLQIKRRLEEQARVHHTDDVIYTIVNDVESYIKKNCSLPSDFDFNELESGLIKVLYATIPYNA